jgi:hypothetical protein
MKTIVLSAILIVSTNFIRAQNVNIPDTVFLNALINTGVDANGDSLISYEEAIAITELYFDWNWSWGFGISDMTGIEAFINLKWLTCIHNNLTSLDVSNNTALERITCYDNQLSSVDVTNNTALVYLYLDHNQLSSLDVTNNTALVSLSLDNNQLSNLDVTNNTALIDLSCGANQLTSLDISNNTELEYLNILYMPTLFEVCVRNDFSPESININTVGSPNVCFETDCNGVCNPTIIEEYNKEVLSIFPNPSDDIINIGIENPNNTTLEMYDTCGKIVFIKSIHSKIEKINVSGLSEGMYYIKVKQSDKVYIGKVVVK